MSIARKFVVYGPIDTLKRMNQAIIEGTSPYFHYTSTLDSNDYRMDVCVYEDHQKIHNSTSSVSLIMEFSGKSVHVQIVSTGGRTGFRGSVPSEDIPVSEVVTDFIIDFSKRFGLTMQEVSEKGNLQEQV